MKIDLEKKWEEAIKKTKIVRSRYGKLNTFQKTILPYILVNKSLVSKNTTVIREGKVEVSRAMIHLPDNSPIFSGFDFSSTTEFSEETIKTFLLIRGVRFPSLKYSHNAVKLEVVEKSLDQVVKEYLEMLRMKEDIDTGLIIGLPDVWQFSVLIYIATQVMKSVDSDIKNIFEHRRDIFNIFPDDENI